VGNIRHGNRIFVDIYSDEECARSLSVKRHLTSILPDGCRG
jgi:hypothetical protein